jgi:hypothetical protein
MKWSYPNSQELKVEASDGKTAVYRFIEASRHTTRIDSKGYRLKEAHFSHKPSEIYSYQKYRVYNRQRDPESNEPAYSNKIFLTRKAYPNGRFVKIDYYEDEDLRRAEEKQQIFKRFRVKSKQGPVGTDGEAIVTHKFDYVYDRNQGGTTSVFDAYGRKTDYIYDRHLRPTQIKKYVGNQYLSGLR